MSANVETMAYRFGERADTPWHGLGVAIDRNEVVTTDDFLKRAGADWKAQKRKLYMRSNASDIHATREVDGTYALARSDNHYVLNIVSDQYKPVQNSEVFDFFREFCEAGSMDMETGGVLNYGKTVWALASIKEGFTLRHGDTVSGYLLFSNSHDGHAGRAKFTPIRVVCANTLALAHGGSGNEFRIHHRTKFNPEVAKQHLGLASRQLAEFQERAELLVSRSMDDLAFTRFVDRLFPQTTNAATGETTRPRNYDKAVQALATQVSVRANEGTWWHGYNAITYMVDHDNSRADKSKQLNSTWFGNGFKLKQQALDLALEMAK